MTPFPLRHHDLNNCKLLVLLDGQHQPIMFDQQATLLQQVTNHHNGGSPDDWLPELQPLLDAAAAAAAAAGVEASDSRLGNSSYAEAVQADRLPGMRRTVSNLRLLLLLLLLSSMGWSRSLPSRQTVTSRGASPCRYFQVGSTFPASL
jgi:hypothetical protein